MTRNLLTFNKTLNLYTFNLPSGRTCPGKSDWCKKHCYAAKGNFLYANVRDGQAWRWGQTQDLDAFVEAMVKEIRERNILHVRIHSAGDFYSVDYFRAWLEIARRLPAVKFLAYTRTWRIPEFAAVLPEAESVPNLTLWYSSDCSTGEPPNAPRVAFVLPRDGNLYCASMVAPNCLKQQDHEQDCLSCGRCFDRNRKAVTFLQH